MRKDTAKELTICKVLREIQETESVANDRQSEEEPENRQGAQAAQGEGKPVGLLPAPHPARNAELQEMASQPTCSRRYCRTSMACLLGKGKNMNVLDTVVFAGDDDEKKAIPVTHSKAQQHKLNEIYAN